MGHLLFGLPLLLHLLLLFALGMGPLEEGLFLFGYTWSWFLFTPQVALQVRKRKYRFSFLRLCFGLDSILQSRFRARGSYARSTVIRLAVPFGLMAACFSLFNIVGKSVFTLWGSVASESVHGLFFLFFSCYPDLSDYPDKTQED